MSISKTNQSDEVELHTETTSLPLSKSLSTPTGTIGHSFKLTHPKNYLGVPLAVATDAPSGILIQQYLVKMAGEARLGAIELGLITQQDELTAKGELFVDSVTSSQADPEDGLIQFSNLKGARSRFSNSTPKMAEAGQQIFCAHPVVASILDVIKPTEQLTLPDVVCRLAEEHPEVVTEAFITPETIPDDSPVQTLRSGERPHWLSETDSYLTLTTFQLKSLLCHVGILTMPGSDSSDLTPDEDTWCLSPQLSAETRDLALAHVGGDL